ncbi:MAG: serine protease [Pseudomonadota bacterium]
MPDTTQTVEYSSESSGSAADDLPIAAAATNGSQPAAGESTYIVEEALGEDTTGFESVGLEAVDAINGDESVSYTSSTGEFAIIEASSTLLQQVPEVTEDAATDFQAEYANGAWESEFGTEALTAEADEAMPEFLPPIGAAMERQQPEFLGALLGKALPIVASAGPKLLGGIFKRLRRRTRGRIRRSRRSADPVKALLAQLLSKLETTGEFQPVDAETYGEESAAEAALAEETAAVLEVILGRDDRVRITSTTRTPWKRYCALRISMGDRQFIGTGCLTSRNTVLTAGHCVYMPDIGWASEIEVIPGSNGSDQPFGSAKSNTFRSVRGWVKNGRPEFDYGCIKLPNGAFSGHSLGHFGYAAFSQDVLLSRRAVLAGYPGDKPFGQLWGMSRRLKRVTARQLHYDIDTMGGQSGSGVYIKCKGRRYLVGIHNYGSNGGNMATRITPSVFNNIKKWSSE